MRTINIFSNQQTLADPCYTTDGRIGNCTSVRSCYPKVKLPKLSPKSWVTASLRGTCHYLENGKQVTTQNKIFYKISIYFLIKQKYILHQVFGVCCPLKNDDWRSNIDAVVIDSLHVINPQIDPELATERIMLVDRMSNKVRQRRQTGCGAGPFKTLNSKEQKIVGGTEAIKNSWPFMASLLQILQCV